MSVANFDDCVDQLKIWSCESELSRKVWNAAIKSAQSRVALVFKAVAEEDEQLESIIQADLKDLIDNK